MDFISDPGNENGFLSKKHYKETGERQTAGQIKTGHSHASGFKIHLDRYMHMG
jgi:hypothetical protein